MDAAPRARSVWRLTVLALLTTSLATSLACRAGTEGPGERAASDVTPAANATAAGPSGDVAPAAAPTWPRWAGALPGRIVVMAADDDRDDPTNVAWSIAPESGERTELWRTEEPEVLEARVDPTGRTMAYRESWHAEPRTEALVVRALEQGAEPQYVALLDPELGRLAGHRWSPDGSAVAYGRQLGDEASFGGAGGNRGWELHAVAVGGARSPNESNDRVLWRASAEEVAGRVLHLVDWRPGRQRALLSAADAAQGTVDALWELDLASGTVLRRIAGPEPATEVAVGPMGNGVIWLTMDGAVRLLDLAAEPPLNEGFMLDPDGLATRPLWSLSGGYLALTVFGDAATSVRLVGLEGAFDRGFRDTLERQAVTFGPQGFLLLAAGLPGAAELLEAHVVPLDAPDRPEESLGWRFPEGTWEVAWVSSSAAPSQP